MKKLQGVTLVAFAALLTSCSDTPESLKQASTIAVSPKIVKKGEEVVVTGTGLNEITKITWNEAALSLSSQTPSEIKFASAGKGSGSIKYYIGAKLVSATDIKVQDDAWTKVAFDKTFKKVSFVSPTEAYAITERSISQKPALFKTNDGGKSWKELPVLLTDTANFYLQPDKSIVVSLEEDQSNCTRSVDGGASWKPFQLTGGLKSGYNFMDAQEGWVIVSEGAAKSKLMKTTNGGQTWNAVYEFAAFMPEGKLVHVAGNTMYLYAKKTGALHLSTDAGKHWKTIDLPVAHGKEAIFQYVNNQEFYLGDAFSRRIYKTIDGGTTFSLVGKLPFEALMQSFKVVDAGLIHVVGAGGESCYSSDGGATWQWYHVNDEGDLQSPNYTDSNIQVLIKGTLWMKKLK